MLAACDRIRVLSLTCAFAFCSLPVVAAQESHYSDLRAAFLVKELWSTDDSKRQEAKDALAEIGSPAAPSLVELLEETLKNPGPRFAQGTEDIGRSTYDQFEAAVAQRDWQATNRLLPQLASLNITPRLRQDAMDVLASIKAVNSVRTLVRLTVLWPQQGGLGSITVTPDMKCLIKIGRPAVPELIRLMNTAQEQASQLMDEGVLHDGVGRQGVIDAYGGLFQRRIIITLGKIGDPRAMPALQSFLSNNDSESLAIITTKAIYEILGAK